MAEDLSPSPGRSPTAEPTGEAEIGALLAAYRGDDARASSRAAEALLIRFAPLREKYLRLLRDGSFRAGDPEMARFLALFGPEAGQTAATLRLRLASYDREDLAQELALALLETARRHACIVPNFRWAVKARLLGLLGQEHPRCPCPEDLCEEQLSERQRALRPADAFGGDPARRLFPRDPALDAAWVRGDTARGRFEALTAEQRALVVELWGPAPLGEPAIRARRGWTRYRLNQEKARIRGALAPPPA